VRKNEKSRAFTQQEKDAMPMKNAAIDRIGKYSISKEFDGKEVEGTLSMKEKYIR
jgi:hypothetical protein